MIFNNYVLVENMMIKMIYKASEQLLIEPLANFALAN